MLWVMKPCQAAIIEFMKQDLTDWSLPPGNFICSLRSRNDAVYADALTSVDA